jgi:hypothetical protein
MNKFEEDLCRQEGHLSHQEIIRRFEDLFGRKMTQAERREFLLEPLPEKKAA